MNEYDLWLEELRSIADIQGIDLIEELFQYHTYYIRGWSPESTAKDISEKETSHE